MAYSVYSSANFYKNTGLFSIYAGTSGEHFLQAQDAINKEVQSLLSEGVSQDEIDRSKKQLKGHIIINLESSAAWVNWIGKQMIYSNETRSIEDVIRRLEAVSEDDILRVASNVFMDDYKVLVSLGKNIDG